MSAEKKKEKKEREKVSVVIRNNWIMIKKVAHFTPEYIVWMILMSVFWGIANAADSYLMFAILNECDEPSPSLKLILFCIGLYLVWNLVMRISNEWWFQYYKPIVDKRLQTRMHSEMFEHALSMDLACFDDPKFYNDYVFAMDESKNRAEKALSDAGTLLRQLITFSAIVGLLSQVSLAVGTLIVGVGLIQTVLNNIINKMYFKKDEKTKPLYRKRDYINRIYHLADYAKELRMSRAHENMQTLYDDATDNIITEEVGLAKRTLPLSSLNCILDEILMFMPMLILLFGLFDGSVQLGGYVAAVDLLWTLNWSIQDFTRTVLKLPENARYAQKYIKFMEYKPKIVGGKKKAEPFESLEFRNVTFTYKEDADEVYNSLDNVSFKVKRGETLAIVGYNGSGKTTLTKLVMRLYDPIDGEILYNGVNLKEYDIASLREQISAVFQDYKIFAATLGENTAAGARKEGDEERLLEALDKSTFDRKMQELEHGLETNLTREFRDDGVNLSGGEAQKVAISRIFANAHSLVIMDEPSSALDPEAEYELNQTLMQHADESTMIFISHRLSTTRNADRILMFDGGKLIEQGSHSELIAKEGKYAEMFNLQAEKYRRAAESET